MSSWWCYISFSYLFKAVNSREPTEEEKTNFKDFTQTQLNQWVIDSMAQTRGRYVAVMMNGYLAFTVIPIFMKGIWDKMLRFEEGATKTEFVTSYGSEYWYEVVKQNGTHRLITHWNNGGEDHGTGEITLESDGYLNNFVLRMPDNPGYDRAYNFDTSRFTPVGQGAELTRRFVTAGLED